MIEFESVYLKQKDKKIFSDFNLVVEKNQKVLIQGKSGIGKTTLFRILLGFETINKGRVSFNGLDINRENIKTIRGQIFYLSQDIDLKEGNVSHLIDEIIDHNLSKNIDEKKFQDLKSFLDLDDAIFSQAVKELSGGERQRIGLLLCFLLDRPVWFLDEPTAAIDDKMKARVADYILEQKKTVIIISHDSIWKENKKIIIERWT